MTSKAKKLLITTQKHEIFIMHLGTVETVLGFCDRCGAEVEMLTLDSAVKDSGINGHRLIEQITARQIHSIETANGHLLICRNSISKALNTPASPSI